MQNRIISQLSLLYLFGIILKNIQVLFFCMYIYIYILDSISFIKNIIPSTKILKSLVLYYAKIILFEVNFHSILKVENNSESKETNFI